MSLVFPIRLKDGFGVPGDNDFFLIRISFLSPIFLNGVFLNGVDRNDFFKVDGRFSFSSIFRTGVVKSAEAVVATADLATDELADATMADDKGVEVEGVGTGTVVDGLALAEGLLEITELPATKDSSILSYLGRVLFLTGFTGFLLSRT